MGLGRASATPTRPVTNVNPSSHQLAAPDHEDKPARGHALVTWRDGPMRARPLLGCSEPPERPTRCGCPPARPLDQHISLGGDLVEHGGEAGGQAPGRRREHQKARPGLRATVVDLQPARQWPYLLVCAERRAPAARRLRRSLRRAAPYAPGPALIPLGRCPVSSEVRFPGLRYGFGTNISM